MIPQYDFSQRRHATQNKDNPNCRSAAWATVCTCCFLLAGLSVVVYALVSSALTSRASEASTLMPPPPPILHVEADATLNSEAAAAFGTVGAGARARKLRVADASKRQDAKRGRKREGSASGGADAAAPVGSLMKIKAVRSFFGDFERVKARSSSQSAAAHRQRRSRRTRRDAASNSSEARVGAASPSEQELQVQQQRAAVPGLVMTRRYSGRMHQGCVGGCF